jgi:hypothetical protein
MSYNTIKVRKFSDIQDEHKADAAITPGMLLEITTTGVKKHATAAGKHAFLFALEDELQGNGINDDYAAADKVQCWVAGRGDIVYALLEDEANIAKGDFVESNGEGKVQAVSGSYPIGVALEAVDLSTLPEGSESSAGGEYYNPRILIQII